MRRFALCLVVVLGALVAAPAALAAGGPFLVSQGGAGVATHDGRFHYVAVSTSNTSTVLERLQVDGGQVNGWVPLKGLWGTPILGATSPTGQGLSRDGRTLVLASTAQLASPSTFLVVDTRRMHVRGTIVLRAPSPSTRSRRTARGCT